MMEKQTQCLEKETDLEVFFEEMLHSAPIIARGKDGIILRIDMSKLDPSVIKLTKGTDIETSTKDDYALKILKIYHLGEGEREYNIQKEAYELLKDVEGVAKIPKPIIMRTQHLSNIDKEYLKKHNPFIGDDAEIILMDYIEGKDLAVIIYDFILSNNGYDENSLKNMEFEQKQEEIGRLVNFEMAENADPGDFRDIISKRDNLRKLMELLRKYNFHINQDTLDQIKRGLNILESNMIFHGDLHERNVMIGDDGVPYIIDFGRSVRNKADQKSDDFTVIRRFEALNKEKNIEYGSSYWKSLIEKISKNEKWISILKDWEKQIINNEQKIVYNTILSISVDGNNLEQHLGAIGCLFNTIEEKHKEKILWIVTQLHRSVKTEFTKRKVKNFKNYLE